MSGAPKSLAHAISSWPGSRPRMAKIAEASTNIRRRPTFRRYRLSCRSPGRSPDRVGERLGARQTTLERRRAPRLGKLSLKSATNRLGLGLRPGELEDLFRQSGDLGVADEKGHPDISQA